MTSDAGITTSPEPVAPEENPGTLQRFAGALLSPDETFASIARKPDVLVPLVILTILAIVSTFVVIPHMDFATSTRESLESSGRDMAPEDIERSVRMGSAVAKGFGYISPLFLIGFWAAIAGVLLLAFRLFGGQGTFKQAFSTTLYAWLPLTINSIISTIVILIRGVSVDPREMSALVMSNAAAFVDFHEHPILYSFLSSFDVFTLWSVVLFIIGFAWLSSLSKSRSAAIVISLWLFFFVFIKLGFAALGAARMKSGA